MKRLIYFANQGPKYWKCALKNELSLTIVLLFRSVSCNVYFFQMNRQQLIFKTKVKRRAEQADLTERDNFYQEVGLNFASYAQHCDCIHLISPKCPNCSKESVNFVKKL